MSALASKVGFGPDVNLSDPQQVLAEAVRLFHPRLVMASSFSHEDVLLMALAAEVEPGIRVFSLDTGRLPEETYALADTVSRQLGIQVEWFFPDRERVEALQRSKGMYSFRESLDSRHECCRIRKVEPLQRALHGAEAWITGQRRSQSVTRSDLAVLEPAEGGPLKINPLAEFSSEQVLQEVRRRRLPENALYAQGYASIGCAPCTRAVRPGEDERSGRWWWELPEHKECGLHQRMGTPR